MENLETSAEKAYQAILKRILEGELPRGEFLSQRMLAEIADTSIISVREALKRLENDRLIESIPRWGVRIPIETRERIVEMYGVREAVEVMIAYLLCKDNNQRSKKEILKLADEIDGIDTTNPDNIPVLAKKHRKFHLYLAECAGNKLLMIELKRLSLWSLMYQDCKEDWESLEENWSTWHKNLVLDIYSEDVNRAQEAMHAHIQHGLHGDLLKFDKGFFN